MSNPFNYTDLVEKSNAKFNNKYSFVEDTYVNRYTKMTVVCPIHVEFQQVPETHLRSVAGCSKCGIYAPSVKKNH